MSMSMHLWWGMPSGGGIREASLQELIFFTPEFRGDVGFSLAAQCAAVAVALFKMKSAALAAWLAAVKMAFLSFFRTLIQLCT